MENKKKFNVVDVIIIITVLLLICVSVYRTISIKKAKALTEEKNITFTVMVNNLDTIYYNSIKENDAVYLADNKLMCGTVDSVNAEYTVKTESIADENGEAVTVSGIDPSKIKLSVTVNTSGHFADSMLYLGNNTYLSEGQRMVFYNDTFTFEGIITDFVEK